MKKAKPKAKPLTLKNLIVWLRKKPARGQYVWHEPTNCVIGQWLRASGTPDTEIWAKSVHLAKDDLFTAIALNGPYTFGAALKRAEAALNLAQQKT